MRSDTFLVGVCDNWCAVEVIECISWENLFWHLCIDDIYHWTQQCPNYLRAYFRAFCVTFFLTGSVLLLCVCVAYEGLWHFFLTSILMLISSWDLRHQETRSSFVTSFPAYYHVWTCVLLRWSWFWGDGPGLCN